MVKGQPVGTLDGRPEPRSGLSGRVLRRRLGRLRLGIQARRDGHQDGLLEGICSGLVDKLQRPGMDGPASLIADDVALLIHDRAPGSMADRRPFENWLIATPSIKRSVRPTILRHR